MVAVIVYRLAVFFTVSRRLREDIKGLEPFKEYVTPQMATTVTASIISVVIIMILNNLYEKVAIWITDFGGCKKFVCYGLRLVIRVRANASYQTEAGESNVHTGVGLGGLMFLYQGIMARNLPTTAVYHLSQHNLMLSFTEEEMCMAST